jgi:nicotinate dehydrogenase subunit A
MIDPRRSIAGAITAVAILEEIQKVRDYEAHAMNAPAPIHLDVNGSSHLLNIPPRTALLYVLRNDLRLNGPKFGCGLGECGACAVLVDGDCAPSCVIPVGNVVGRKIVTLEGLGTADSPHPIQRAFIAAQAAQCGYCLNGMIMAAKALLDRNVSPTDLDIKQALQYHLCRCGTHIEIVDAVRRARDALAHPASTP